MRSRVPFVVALLATTAAVACTAPSADDDAEGQTSNVTGGSNKVESPTVFLFAAEVRETPKCMGALVSDSVAITAKGCAQVGMPLARAKGKDATKVKAIHTPPEADAEIELVELEGKITGTHARLTHMPLRDGYAVNGVAAEEGRGLFFQPEEGGASSIEGRMTDEFSHFGSLTPKKGSAICTGDRGAPVCSTTGTKIFGSQILGTCGLSGLVVDRKVAPTSALPEGDKGCSDQAWKVAQIGRHADFIRRYAPEAFEPLRLDIPLLRHIPYVPDGLWGYKTAGRVLSCKLDTTAIADTAPGAATPKLEASVKFSGMELHSSPWGRFGIARKDEPTKITWLGAKKVRSGIGEAFDAKFEGVVSSAIAGDYLVVFRASANGGESWVQCDTDGIENGFDIAKAVAVKITTATSPTTPPSNNPGTPPPADQSSPQDQGSGYSDPPPSSSDESDSEPGTSEEESDGAFKRKDSGESGGCSTSSSAPASSGLPLLGVLLGLASLKRKKRA